MIARRDRLQSRMSIFMKRSILAICTTSVGAYFEQFGAISARVVGKREVAARAVGVAQPANDPEPEVDRPRGEVLRLQNAEVQRKAHAASGTHWPRPEHY